MLNAVVAINGPLGDAVVLTLERATPPWRVRCASNDSEGQADIVIVDEDLVASERRSLLARWTAPVLILGRDLGKPFTVAALRAKALSAARPAIAIDGFVAADRPLRAALEILDVAATRKGGVLIMGPTGVGKERLARRVHERSGRRGPFVAMNCAALSERSSRVSSSATSAAPSPGRSAGAGPLGGGQGGTVFLDEAGEMPPPRAGEAPARPRGLAVRAWARAPIGTSTCGSSPRRTATWRPRTRGGPLPFGSLLPPEREITLAVPPLRERQRRAAARLANHFLRKFAADNRRRSTASGDQARARSSSPTAWPGNVRELENAVERVFALAPPGELTFDDLVRLAPEIAPAALLDPRARSCIERAQCGEISKLDAAAELGVHRTTVWRQMKRMQGGKTRKGGKENKR